MTPSVDCLHVGRMWSNLFRALSPVSQSSSCNRITRMGLTSWRRGVKWQSNDILGSHTLSSVDYRLCVCVCVCIFMCAYDFLSCVCIYVYACVHLCVHLCVRLCVHLCVRLCVHLCVRLCVRLCVHLCVMRVANGCDIKELTTLFSITIEEHVCTLAGQCIVLVWMPSVSSWFGETSDEDKTDTYLLLSHILHAQTGSWTLSTWYYTSITIVQSYTGKYHEIVAVCIATSAQHE